MAGSFLEAATAGVDGLRGVFITVMPDCLLFDAWVRDDSWRADEIASYFGDLVRANREGLRSIGSWSSDMQVTIESADSLVVISEVSQHFVCGCVFERGAPLGMVRLQLKRLLERVVQELPNVAAEERPRGVRVVEFLHRYAPDPHAVLARVSLRSGLAMEKLENPETLSEVEIGKLEEAAKRVLGLEAIHV